jgi:hypothetical protein
MIYRKIGLTQRAAILKTALDKAETLIIGARAGPPQAPSKHVVLVKQNG